MYLSGSLAHSALVKNRIAMILLFVSIVLFMGNLNALVDKFLHPEIPYFDSGHVIVGLVTAMVTTVLYGSLISQLYHLQSTINALRYMSSILPICAYCKKIRKPNADPRSEQSWESIEMYLTEDAKKGLSHGICPECLKNLYPEYSDILLKKEAKDKSPVTKG